VVVVAAVVRSPVNEAQFESVNHRKLYGLVSAGLAVLLLLAAAVTASYVGNTMELTAELRYGWHAAYTGKSPATGITKAQGKGIIRATQRDLQCCGFGRTTKEQSFPPCAPAAHFGCEAPLLEELQESLLWLAGLEAAGALFSLFALAVVACNAEAARDAMNRGEAPGGGKSGGRRVRHGLSASCVVWRRGCLARFRVPRRQHLPLSYGVFCWLPSQAERPHNPHEVIYPPVMGHFVAGGGTGPGGLLPRGGAGWDEHALVGGSRTGAASMTSANTSEPGARTITHRSGVF
jgi:hypothetical protein